MSDCPKKPDWFFNFLMLLVIGGVFLLGSGVFLFGFGVYLYLTK